MTIPEKGDFMGSFGALIALILQRALYGKHDSARLHLLGFTLLLWPLMWAAFGLTADLPAFPCRADCGPTLLLDNRGDAPPATNADQWWVTGMVTFGLTTYGRRAEFRQRSDWSARSEGGQAIPACRWRCCIDGVKLIVRR